MVISRDAAFDLFSKWKTESTPIRFAFSDRLMVSFMVRVSQINHSALILRGQNEEVDFVCIPLGDDAEFDYADVREAPPGTSQKTLDAVASILQIGTAGCFMALFELN